MKETKKIRVKVKKRKLKVKNLLLLILILILLGNFVYYVLNIKIKNIYVLNNELISDRLIINNALLEDYPSYILTFSKRVEKNILKNNPYIKSVSVSKKKLGIYIYLVEYKKIAIYKDKILLEDGSLQDNTYDVNYLPIIINDISNVYDYFVSSFTKVDDNILTKISQINYDPNEVDKERFLLYMNDGNSVYITLSKITKLNKYDSIVSQMENRNGIIYLDSGDYIELK